MAPETDLLGPVAWECAATSPGEAACPDDLDGLPLRWIPAPVPGTVAGAWREAGIPEPSSDELDAHDWWFRCRFTDRDAGAGADGDGTGDGAGGDAGAGADGGPAGRHLSAPEPGRWLLELTGLATIADGWLNGHHLVHSESMFESHRIPVGDLEPDNELCIRFSALAPHLAARRPRPRWKSMAATSQNLRWYRTTLLGRQPGWAVTPAPVGPWRPVRLVPRRPVRLDRRRLTTTCQDDGRGGTSGTVAVELRCSLGGPSPTSATLEIGGRTAPLAVEADGDQLVAHGEVTLPEVERWWPHTHGPQPLYPAVVIIGSTHLDLGAVGFRTIEVDRSGGGFEVAVNGVPVFCRGACWYPLDPVSFNPPAGGVAATLGMARDAGMNMVRVPGGTVYEDDHFFSVCDRLGVMVWQDVMLGFLDPPDDGGFSTTVAGEVADVFSGLAGHPSLAIVCGGQELEEQPAMLGLPRASWQTPLVTEIIPEVVGRLLPRTAYLTSSPTGGDLPFQIDEGVSHYVGVGVFMRPLEDLRRAAPRFVSEGLAFAVPPEQATVERCFGSARQAGHDPTWKRAVHHDTGGSWDLEDVRDHYVRVLFGVEPALLRRQDPDRALDLGRAAVSHVVAAAVAEWRRVGSPCAGVLFVGLRDLVAGAGWGSIDALGRPKSSFYALARSFRPVAVLITDEGLNGLALHLVNDSGVPVEATLVVELYSADHRVEAAGREVEIPARGGDACSAGALFDGFRDLTFTYRFGPSPYAVVVARLVGAGGATIHEAMFLPEGPGVIEPDVGLQAVLAPADDGVWPLSVSTRRLARYVCVDVPGFRPDDSWFHLPPGTTKLVLLRPEGPTAAVPRGRVRALNSSASARVTR